MPPIWVMVALSGTGVRPRLTLAVTRGTVTVQTVIALYGSSVQTLSAPALQAVPQTVYITADIASSLQLGALQIGGSGVLTLTLTAPANAALDAPGASALDVTGVGSSTLTLQGTAADLQAWLADPQALRYTGSAGTLTLRLADASGQQFSQLALALATPAADNSLQRSGRLSG